MLKIFALEEKVGKKGWGESVAWGGLMFEISFIQSAANLAQLFIWGLKHTKKIQFF